MPKEIGLIFLLILFVNADDEFSRKLTTVYNPGCPDCATMDPPVHLAYTRGVSSINKKDVMHFVVSGGGALGPVTALLIRSDGVGSELNFNWSRILSEKMTDRKEGITLGGGTVVFKAAYIVARLWEYNDTKDDANMTHVPPTTKKGVPLWNTWDTDQFVWTVDASNIEKSHTIEFVSNQTVPFTTLSTTAAPSTTPSKANATTAAPSTTPSKANATTPALSIVKTSTLAPLTTSSKANATTPAPSTTPSIVNATTTAPTTPAPTAGPGWHDQLFKAGSHIKLRFVMNGAETRANVLPRLAFTGNSTQLDVVLDHLNTNFTGSRFAISMVQIVSLPQSDSTMNVVITKSVDDELTPGIFKTFDWNAQPKKIEPATEHDRAFLQWKPICYTTAERHLKESQQMFNYMLPSSLDSTYAHIIERSVSFPMFSTSKTPMYDALPMNISFGQGGDGFYVASKYISWTSSAGLGKPPTDEVSVLVILIITIGLGVPVVLIILGSIYICIRRRRVVTHTYERIN